MIRDRIEATLEHGDDRHDHANWHGPRPALASRARTVWPRARRLRAPPEQGLPRRHAVAVLIGGGTPTPPCALLRSHVRERPPHHRAVPRVGATDVWRPAGEDCSQLLERVGSVLGRLEGLAEVLVDRLDRTPNQVVEVRRDANEQAGVRVGV